MKRVWIAVLLCLALAACSAPDCVGFLILPNGSSSAGAPQSAEPAATLTGRVAAVDETGFLLAGEGAGDLYTVGLPGQTGLVPGQMVEVGFSGEVLETWPASLVDPISVRVAAPGEDLVGLYRRVFDDLWNTDEGLNPAGGLAVLAFDLTGVSNLSDGEKEALVWLVSGDHGMTGISGTFEELCGQGYIDREALYFENGLLLKLEVTGEGEDCLSFHAEKWRGGLGAYYFHDCRASKGAGGWDYTVGAQMIS